LQAIVQAEPAGFATDTHSNALDFRFRSRRKNPGSPTVR
jgi:hypothetical protein